MMKRIALFAVALALSPVLHAQKDYFSNWPAGTDPKEVGKKVADHFVTSPHQYTKTLHYSEANTWQAALAFAQLTNDDALRQGLIARFEPLMPGGSDTARVPTRQHVDDEIFGIVPLQAKLRTQNHQFVQRTFAVRKDQILAFSGNDLAGAIHDRCAAGPLADVAAAAAGVAPQGSAERSGNAD